MKENNNNQQILKSFKENKYDAIKNERKVHGNKESNEEISFNVTFGKEEKQFFNQLFDTAPKKIHSKKIMQARGTSVKEAVQCSNFSKRPHSNFKIRSRLPIDQLQDVKQQLSKVTYSIKTIESRHNEQIGISSKRVFMGKKHLEMQKLKLNSQQRFQNNRCQSSLGFRPISEFQIQNDQNLETARFNESKSTVNKNKFSSKRLNVLIKRKSLFQKQKNSQLHLEDHFMFFDSNSQTQKKNEYKKEIEKNDLNWNKISIRKQNTLRQKLQNKKLIYDQYLMKKQGKILGQKIENSQKKQQKECNFILPENCHKNTLDSKKKLSLSNFISQFNTSKQQNGENMLFDRKNLLKPLKQVFKNKFSTISKISNNENSVDIQKAVFKMRTKKNTILSNQSNKQNKQNLQMIQKEPKSSQISTEDSQFLRYNEKNNSNFYF